MPETMLPAYLWALRAEVEGQLRRLTDVQRQVEGLPQASPIERAHHADRLVQDLKDILEANSAVRDLCRNALESAQELQGASRAE